MEEKTRNLSRVPLVLIFVGLPLLLYTIGEYPRRTYLKEFFSLITIVAVFLMISQFFLVRANSFLMNTCSAAKRLKLHRRIGYVFTSVLLVHPLLIVVPRSFEAGIGSKEAFLTIITSFDSLGVMLGIVAWFLMIVLVVISLFRKELPLSYKRWRAVHGVLSVMFVGAACLHAIDLGRHFDWPMSCYMLILLVSGVLFWLKSYIARISENCWSLTNE